MTSLGRWAAKVKKINHSGTSLPPSPHAHIAKEKTRCLTTFEDKSDIEMLLPYDGARDAWIVPIIYQDRDGYVAQKQ